MIKKLNLNSPRFTKAFTLIELLVVIAIIGILSSVVVVSINNAREKSKIASIKSTLKQLYNQASINHVVSGSFIGSNPSYSDLTCSGNLASLIKQLEDQGIIVRCYSFYGSEFGQLYSGDDYLRFGATALIYKTNEIKAWSVDENGIVEWNNSDLTSTDLPGGNLKNWNEAKKACNNKGGKLPSIEQARSFYFAYHDGAGATNLYFTPYSFQPNRYWTSTHVLPTTSTMVYYQSMSSGDLDYTEESYGLSVRCVQ